MAHFSKKVFPFFEVLQGARSCWQIPEIAIEIRFVQINLHRNEHYDDKLPQFTCRNDNETLTNYVPAEVS